MTAERPTTSGSETEPGAAHGPAASIDDLASDLPPLRTRDLSEALHTVCIEAVGATDSDTALLFVPDDDDMVCIAAAGQGRSLVGWRLPMDRALARICFETKSVLVIDDVRQDRRADAEVWGNLGARSYACAPILLRSLVAATLEVHDSREGVYGPQTQERMVALAHRATSAFRRAIRDAGPTVRPRLSELPGAVAYQERLATIRTEFSLASVLIVVVGPPLEVGRLHLVRDALIGLRASDLPFVIDADAFAVIMPDTPGEGAQVAARRIAKMLRERGLTGVGLGTAEIEDPIASHEAALKVALTDLRRPPPPVLP